MSGISFKIQAPPRPSASTRNGSTTSTQPPSRSTSRSASVREEDDSGSEHERASYGTVAADNRAHGDASRRKRAKLLEDGDEEVVEFGVEGARSKYAKAPTGPLVIAALPNKDWRKAAEELRAGRNTGRRKQIYLPEASGSGMSMQQGDNTRSTVRATEVDAINTEEVVGGLSTRPALPPSGRTEEAVEQVRQEVAAVGVSTSTTETVPVEARTSDRPPTSAQVFTEEQRALRELLGHEATTESEQIPEAILSAPDDRGGPLDESEAFKRDVDTRPDEASLDDYARVPVGQFGMAMLRGMGWQPGQAASRSGRGAIEAHVPSSRPSLLGIGAKPMTEALGTGADAKGKSGGKPPPRTSKRDEMRFVPLMKRERDADNASARSDSAEPSRRYIDSASSSRRPSKSPPPSSSRHSSRRASPSGSSSRRTADERDRRRYADDYKSRHSRDERDSRRSRDDDARRSQRSEKDDYSSRRRPEDDEYRRDSSSRRDDARYESSSRSSRLREDEKRPSRSGSYEKSSREYDRGDSYASTTKHSRR